MIAGSLGAGHPLLRGVTDGVVAEAETALDTPHLRMTLTAPHHLYAPRSAPVLPAHPARPACSRGRRRAGCRTTRLRSARRWTSSRGERCLARSRRQAARARRNAPTNAGPLSTRAAHPRLYSRTPRPRADRRPHHLRPLPAPSPPAAPAAAPGRFRQSRSGSEVGTSRMVPTTQMLLPSRASRTENAAASDTSPPPPGARASERTTADPGGPSNSRCTCPASLVNLQCTKVNLQCTKVSVQCTAAASPASPAGGGAGGGAKPPQRRSLARTARRRRR